MTKAEAAEALLRSRAEVGRGDQGRLVRSRAQRGGQVVDILRLDTAPDADANGSVTRIAPEFRTPSNGAAFGGASMLAAHPAGRRS